VITSWAEQRNCSKAVQRCTAIDILNMSIAIQLNPTSKQEFRHSYIAS
jgi:hypothetical protein